MSKNVIVAISAASCFIYGLETIKQLLLSGYNVELVISQNAYYIANQELGIELCDDKEVILKNILSYLELQDKSDNLKIWLNNELHASIASGSYKCDFMVLVPASMAMVAKIACGLSDDLISRAADVVIKEGRKLVIVPRETPFSAIHLENMLKLSKIGVGVVPAIPGFYSKTDTIEDAINFVVGKVLDYCNVENNLYQRWE